MAATPVLTVQDAIDRVGFVRFQRRLLLVCGVTWAADAAEILLLAFALPVISAEFSLSRAAGGLLITSTFLGMLIGAWFWGWWPTGSAAGPASSSPSSSSPYSGPVGAGPQPGHADGAAGADRVRAGGRPAARLCRVRRVPAQPQPGPQPGAGELLGAGARVAAAGLALLLVPTVGWRPLLASSALVFWIRRQVPESPRYLAASGHAAQARQVLAQVAEANRQPLPAGELQGATRGPAVRMASLWSRPYRDPR
jgi:MFS transporter, putative metabolite:H+ symporter